MTQEGKVIFGLGFGVYIRSSEVEMQGGQPGARMEPPS